MNTFLTKLRLIFSDGALVKRLAITAGILILFRLGGSVPIPGVDHAALAQFLATNSFLSLLSLFSGGGVAQLSIFMLAVGPYITASIIMQLMTMIFPSLKEMYQEEGDLGRKKFGQYTRVLSIPLGFIQGFGILALLKSQGILGAMTFADQMLNLGVIVAGAVLVMWLGELISEYGIGNGVSLIIFAGIVASLPTTLSQIAVNWSPADLPLYVALTVLGLLVVGAVVFITEAERPIPVTYAKRVRGMKVYGGASTYLPLRVNQAGVIPIIFALSILLFPQMVVSLFAGIAHPVAQSLVSAITALLNNTWLYSAAYFVLVFVFTYFYTAVTFDPDMIATNLQKQGAFIPGVRPGRPTSEFLGRVLTRLTFVGASFLGLIAVLPLVLQAVTGNATFAIGGTALLIVVSVVLEFTKQLDAQVSMKEY